MTKLKTLIIEDEEASRITLTNYLTKYCPDVELIGEATNILDGHKLITRKKPQLVFLDIEMPYGNAFDLLEKFESIDFQIIFVTAFSDYALRALNLSACKYLLKPLNIDQLVEAVEDVKRIDEKNNLLRSSNLLLENLSIENIQQKKIALPLLDGFEVVTLKDIVQCNANDNLTQFIMVDGAKKTVCRTLKFYEELLSEFNFLRIHKSHVINLNYVKNYKKSSGGEITLTNGVTLSLSASRKEAFLEKFKYFLQS